MSAEHIQPGPTKAAPCRRRMPAEARRQRILEGAALFFAERGLSHSTRELARRLGVSQALIYRYFPSKQALVDEVFAATFENLWDSDWDRLLRDRSQPLEARFEALYEAYLARSGAATTRLFVRAGLDGWDMARRYSVPLTGQMLAPMIAELRAEAGLPDFAQRPMMRGERELAMILHGAVVFLGIRKYVYGMPLPDSLADLVRLQVRTFVDGARLQIRRLHEKEAEESLRVEQLSARGRKAAAESGGAGRRQAAAGDG